MTAYKPAKGDVVRHAFDPTMRGKVTAAGPEQSEVRWDGNKDSWTHSNADLAKAIERVESRRMRRD